MRENRYFSAFSVSKPLKTLLFSYELFHSPSLSANSLANIAFPSSLTEVYRIPYPSTKCPQNINAPAFTSQGVTVYQKNWCSMHHFVLSHLFILSVYCLLTFTTLSRVFTTYTPVGQACASMVAALQ